MKQKPIIAVFFAFLSIFLLSTPIGHAAPGDRIVDEGEFFTNQEIQELQQLFNDQSYAYYLKTVPDLNGENIARFADDELRSLPQGAVLIVLAKEEQEIYISTRNDRIDQRKIEEVTSSFPAYAQRGDFSGGVKEVVQQIEGSFFGSIFSSASTFSKETLFVIVGAIVVVLSFPVTLGHQVYHIILERRRFRDLSNKWATLEQSLYAPYNEVDERIKLSAGKTSENLDAIKNGLWSLIEEVKAYRGSLHYPIRLFKRKQMKKMLKKINSKLKETKGRFNELKARIDELKQLEKEVSANLKQGKSRLQSIHQQVTSWQQEKEWPLQQLQHCYEEANNLLEQAEKHDHSLDYVASHHYAEKAEKQINQLEKDIQTMAKHEEAVHTLEKIQQQVWTDIDQQVKDENLLLPDADPYQSVNDAVDYIAGIREHFWQGDVPGFQEQYDQFQQLLQKGQRTVDQLLELRDGTAVEMNQIRSTIPATEELDQLFAEQMERLQPMFEGLHFDDLPNRYQKMIEHAHDIKKRLFTIEEDLAVNVQQYHRAGQRMNEAKQVFRQYKQEHRECFGRYDQLQQQLSNIKQRVQTAADNLNKSVKTAEAEQLPIAAATVTVVDVQQQLNEIDVQIKQPPLNIHDLETESKQLERDALQLKREVSQWRKQKKQATAELEKVQESYRSFGMSGGLTMHSYRRDFKRSTDTVQIAIDNGSYAEAMADIRHAKGIIREMEKEYRRIQQQKQRDRLRNSSTKGAGASWGNSNSKGGGAKW
ncbi:septation ring formation regulator EzrA [Desmospora activa]|uniref:TLP18.3/Psb32/MOLO-1 phosphatase superfamily protein n=1 Tax=Desmospora activa DSM 45169 TaxID=1121389 RepID=A0A2T4ZA99_9BACL|nr:septation ring formation regulator EzrA [Desmospora activa]PTM58814.1 TLP18.3/Psb32/MOLO-1 phosphatase superfamily protein [Desmospora activa DSM 45169]